MKTILIIQARMGSTRLPGKILLPLGKSTVLEYVVDRCRKDARLADVVVATSTLEHDEPIREWCRQRHVTCFSGSEDDVLSRYYDCASSYSPNYVIRVTSDCPFIDYSLIAKLIDAMERHSCDIVRMDGEEPARGLWSEIVSFQALARMNEVGRLPRYREHVTYYAYEFPDQFSSQTIKLPEILLHPELRITLDTPEDYEMLRRVADHFTGDKLVRSEDVIRYLLDTPEVARINSHICQKPVI